MTSRKGHSFATRQLGTVLGNPAGKPAVRQRLSPMTRWSFKSVPNEYPPDGQSFKNVPND